MSPNLGGRPEPPQGLSSLTGLAGGQSPSLLLKALHLHLLLLQLVCLANTL